jgi:large-conductance mechanosensitive channel
LIPVPVGVCVAESTRYGRSCRKSARRFKKFLLRGNVADLAVAVVIGTAFGLVVKALVADLLTPIIVLIFGNSPTRQALA